VARRERCARPAADQPCAGQGLPRPTFDDESIAGGRAWLDAAGIVRETGRDDCLPRAIGVGGVTAEAMQ
jgi:hypothetical protein